MATFELARPLGLVALLIPIVYLLFAYHLVRPELRSVGSLALWLRVRTDTRAAAASTRWTWRTWVLFLALLAAATTLAGPRYVGPREPRIWTLVVGAGPAGGLGTAGSRRVDRALEAGRAFAAERPRGDRFVWTAAGSAGSARLELPAGEVPGKAFVTRLLWKHGSEWGPWDRPDCVWLPVSGAPPAPGSAGLRRVEFEAHGGPVARTEAGIWTWEVASDVVRLATPEEARLVAPPVVVLEGSAWASGGPLARFAEAWALARGWTLEAADTRAALTLRGPWREAGGEPHSDPGDFGSVGRDGWTAEAEWRTGPLDPTGSGLGSTPFLSHGSLTLVAFGPGLVETRLWTLGEPLGDPAAFAVSWAELFDRAAGEPEGIVALAERRAAEAVQLEPERLRDLAAAGQEPGGQKESAPVGSLPLEAPLALLAGLLFLVARR